MTCCVPSAHAITDPDATGIEADGPALLALSRPLGDGTRQLEFAVPDAHCASCIRSIETGLAALPMVNSARVNLSKRRVRVTFDPDQGDAADLAPAIRASCSVPGVFTPYHREGRLLVDGDGQSLALCCLYATPHTYALWGQWVMQDGVWQGQRLLPEGWMGRSAGFDDPLAWRSTAVPRPAKTQELFGFAYHWWPLEGGQGDFTALGIHGQMVYVSPRQQLVVVRLSDDYEEGAHNEEAIAAFRALGAHLNKTPAN